MVQTPTIETQAPAEEPSAVPRVIADFFQALRQHGVRYCHWKSNLRLERGLQGQTDLDLLIDPAHSMIFRQILDQHGARPVLAAPGREYPAVENYLACDPASGKLFHLHVHYQLVLGEQFVKNYRLPLEEHFLNSAQPRLGVLIPAPELELIVLSLRALLKYRARDAIKDILSIRYPGLPDHIMDEIEWLLAQTSIERVAQRLNEVADVVPVDVVLEFLRTVVRTRRAGYTLLRLRQRVRRALRSYQRSNRMRAALKYFREMWRRRGSFLRFSPARNMTLPDGGTTLALVGADGAGKSTMSQMLRKWLTGKLDVHVYYLGSKQPSRRSELLYMLFRMARRGHRTISRAVGERSTLARLMEAARQSLLYSHCLSIGYDRYGRYLVGRRRALAGSVVIYDRYPLETISARLDYRLLDGPQIPLLANGDSGLIARAFARAEQNLYRKMLPPDHFVVLDVSPEVSLQRKPDHQRAAIEAKSRAVNDLTAADHGAGTFDLIRLSADLPLEDVLRQLKQNVWRVIS